MPQPENPLSEYEQRLAAERILSDAELIMRGASVAESGSIVIGPAQFDRLYLCEDPYRFTPIIFDDRYYEPGLQEDWLNTSVEEALKSHYADPMDIPQAARRMSLPLREVLVLGRNYLLSSHMRNVGAKSVDAIDEVVSRNPYGFELKDDPSPEDIAHICQCLGQVTAKALRLQTIALSKLTVADIVEIPFKDRASWQDVWQKNHMLAGDDHFHNYPEVFAVRFREERTRMGKSLIREAGPDTPDLLTDYL